MNKKISFLIAIIFLVLANGEIKGAFLMRKSGSVLRRSFALGKVNNRSFRTSSGDHFWETEPCLFGASFGLIAGFGAIGAGTAIGYAASFGNQKAKDAGNFVGKAVSPIASAWAGGPAGLMTYVVAAGFVGYCKNNFYFDESGKMQEEKNNKNSKFKNAK